MKKTELAESLRKEFKLSRQEAKAFVEQFFEEVLQVVVEEGRLELRGFGVFRLRRLSGRFIKNPRTGLEVFVEERHSIGFKASSTFSKNGKV